MISKHFNIWSPICSSYQACEVNRAGELGPSVQMRRQEQRAWGFPQVTQFISTIAELEARCFHSRAPSFFPLQCD